MLRGWAGPGAGGLRDEDGGEGGRGRRGARSASANRAGGRAGRGSAAHEPGGWREGAGGGAEDRPFGAQEHLAEHPIGPGGYPLVRVGDKMLPVVRPDGSPGDPKFPFLPEIPESRKLPVGALAFVTTIEANGAGRNVLTSDGARQTFKEGYGRTLAACHEAVLIPERMEEDAAKSPAKGKAEKDAAKATGSGRTGTVAGVERNEKQGMALIRFEDGFEMSCSKTMDCYNWKEGQKVTMVPQPYGTFYEVKQVRRLGGESTITLAENGNGPRIQVQCPYDAILCSSWMDKNKQESHALLLPKEVALGPGSTGKEPIIKAKVKEAKSLPEATLYSLSPGGQFYAPNTSSLHGKYAAGDTMDLTFDPQCRQEVIQQKLIKKDGTVLKFGSGFTMFCKPTDYCSKFEKGQEVVVDSRITGKQGVGTGPEPAGSTHH